MNKLDKITSYASNGIEAMCPQRQSFIYSLFEEYIEMYASRDERLISHFSENFSGYAGSSDQLITSKSEWIRVTEQDFSQITDRIDIEILNVTLQDLSEDVVSVTAFFHIHLPYTENILANETARLTLVFRNEKSNWKIVHSGISIPFGLTSDDEVYPVSGLEQRNIELEEMITQRTKELSEANRLLKIQSNTDGLTNINNRRHFDYLLKHEWQKAYENSTSLSMIMIDIDHFKSFNDRYGHLAGDSCLQKIAQGLSQAARRSGELVARYGGEEFVIILPNTDKQTAFQMAEHIQEVILSLAIPHASSTYKVVTISLGVASLKASNQQLPVELVRQADAALYRAKLKGRNCIQI